MTREKKRRKRKEGERGGVIGGQRWEREVEAEEQDEVQETGRKK